MKKLLFVICASLMFASCEQPYMQIVETKSNNVKQENDYYVYENETVKITYEFWHDRGLMSFAVYNKLETPIYIDWSKSCVINNSSKMNYWFDESTSHSNAYFGEHYYNGPIVAPGYNVNELAGISNSTVAQKYEKVSFIPAKSTYYRSQFHFSSDEFIMFDRNKYEDVPCNEDGKKTNTRVYSLDFDRNNTPLVFRNYLAISKSGKSDDVSYIDNEFYVSGVKAMYIGHAMGHFVMKTNKGINIFQQPYKKTTSFYILQYDILHVDGIFHDRK